MKTVSERLPVLKGVFQKDIRIDCPFEELAASFAGDAGTVLLLSGSDLDSARYHMLAAAPWLEIKSRKENVVIRLGDEVFEIHQDPFEVIRMVLNRFDLKEGSFYLPIHSGLFGYFSYDLKDRIENLPCTCVDMNLPDMCLYAPSILLIQDKTNGRTTLCLPEFSGPEAEQISSNAEQLFFQALKKKSRPGSFNIDHKGLIPFITKKEYIRSVEKIIEYLKAGDIYQANFSQRFETGFSGDAYAFFLDLFNRNPASFFSYINAGDHTIVSTSPERFIQQKGRFVETRPIKGTIARGGSDSQDLENSRKLSSSIKDDAELTMIVDLMRNDLSRVAHHDSVVVKEHKRLEPYENVFHLVSIVEGRLLEDKTSVDLLKATFPGGSITGCPKIRSMEIIDELEPVKRHVYTGSIGYISFHDTMDLSIAIRTATIHNRTLCFSVGGGIVFDSDPQIEYQETLDKGKTLIESLSGNGGKNGVTVPKAWADGRIMDQDKMCIPVSSMGFQYGCGLFETIKVSSGRIYYLNEHIHRLNRSWEEVFSEDAPDVSWERIIRLLIEENQYHDKELAVKIIAAKDERDNGKRFFLAATAKEYVHRLNRPDKKGLDLIIYPHPRFSYLADHKSLNYLFYERAGRFAKKRRADEAVILNPDGTISETNTANILFIKDKSVVIPRSDHLLPGITQKKVLDILADKGYEIRRQLLRKKDLTEISGMILTNSLMGAVPVTCIDSKKIDGEAGGICTMINKSLFKK